MASITFEHVSKRFGRTRAVDDLDLVVADGEFLVLVGPSGCGKSTALRLLAGLEELSGGTIRIGERVVNNVPAKDRDIAMVFQSYALYPHMSVRDNMAFGLKLRGVAKPEIATRVSDAARLLGIDALLDNKPGQLSGGQRQRVALGRAIVREPAVFLLDEPLSNLDAALRVQTRAEIRRLHERIGTTFVYVTHDQVEAMTMATRIAVLRAGALQQAGTPSELYDNPANVFVAGFIGSPAMNFLRLRIERERENLRLTNGTVSLTAPPHALARLTGLASTEVIAGIRPEDIADPAYPRADAEVCKLPASVDLVEPLGSEAYLHLRAGEDTVVARVDPRTSARPGDTMDVTLDLRKLHLFDPETGMAL